jgi:hypothetical protein
MDCTTTKGHKEKLKNLCNLRNLWFLLFYSSPGEAEAS